MKTLLTVLSAFVLIGGAATAAQAESNTNVGTDILFEQQVDGR
jgi:hypothetical protein